MKQLASKDISDIEGNGHLACKVLRVDESLLLVIVLNRFLVHEFVSWLYPKQEQATEQQSITVQCTSNMLQDMVWKARYDVQCIWVLRKGKED